MTFGYYKQFQNEITSQNIKCYQYTETTFTETRDAVKQKKSFFYLTLSTSNYLTQFFYLTHFLFNNVCSANQWTGFYVIGTFVIKELIKPTFSLSNR